MTIILGFLAKFKSQILYAIAIIGAVYSAYVWAYGNGYAAAKKESSDAVLKLQETLQAEYKVEVDKALKLQSQEFDAILKLERENVKVQTKVETVTRYVDKIKIIPECNDFASDIGRVLVESNRITSDAARSAQSSN